MLHTLPYFDEAQLFNRGGTLDSQAALFPDVRRALCPIRRLPMFTLFLSFMGKLEQLSPPTQLESSDRILRLELVPLEPIVWTPFAVFARRITKDKVWTLTEVASTNHIAHLGRPLFSAMYEAAMRAGDATVCEWIIDLACQKLLKAEVSASNSMTQQQILVCIAVRIPIDFNPVPIMRGGGADADGERNVVADHMRLLLWSDGNARSAEARALFDPFLATTHYFGSSLLDLGARGEFAAALLLLYARDRATTFAIERSETPGTLSRPENDSSGRRRIVTVCQFLEAPLGERNVKRVFPDAKSYFNHFIKVKSYDVVHQEYLLLAISRGAAIICADGHVGIGIIIPVLIGTELKKGNLGPGEEQCGLFDRDVKEPPPVLRMVFALASLQAAVASPSIPIRQSQRTDKTAKFTAYDIWCAGASHETFAVNK
ncbi:hypothetical protein BN946_scf184938.g10 [Trametes cinnabarina]|uniref:Uncharacterized protein n=1 Tax=Pycnoporus cinnabarinus TaxID=5643 RepID=A0A060S6Z4_PYCCI|nr:hypothetical protein BN946_scf184938.g10 [Trametes cinnabarina]